MTRFSYVRARGGNAAHLLVLVVAVLTAGTVLCCARVSAASKLPHRSTSAHPDCDKQPGRPRAVIAPIVGGATFPIVAGIDANGCNSWPYELASSAGIPHTFFAGPGFRTGIRAFEYGTRETTTLVRGEQLISVTNPTREWRRVYAGYDLCDDQTGKTVCVAPAVDPRPDDLVLYIPVGVLLAALVIFVVHFVRPAGPIRRRRHFHHARSLIAEGVASSEEPAADASSDTPIVVKSLDVRPIDVKQLRRRLRRLEKFLSPELSESQHRWFSGHLASGRHGLALESVTRWLGESQLPIPDHIREEVLWIASSIEIEQVVRPILDHHVHRERAESATSPKVSEGFDLPLEQFENLVAEAVDSLPEAFGRAMTNVAITVEEEAEGRDAYGVYIGHPLSMARFRQWSIHPDKIIIYRKTICESCRSEEEVRAQVYRTVIHEIAHHFGIDDPRLRELGW